MTGWIVVAGWVMFDPKGQVDLTFGIWPNDWQAFMACGLRSGVTREDLAKDGWTARQMNVMARPA